MAAQDKISVIIPVFNSEKYIESTVRSIMGQTYKNLEIICVNDGSLDDSIGILNRLAMEDERIIVLSKDNEGAGFARNYALKYASSEWISFIDADDTLQQDAYEQISVAFKEYPDMIHFGIRMVTEDGSAPDSRDVSYYSLKYQGLTEVNDSVILKSDFSASNKLFRKSVIDKYGIHFEKIYYEDFQFTVQYMSVIDNVYYLKKELYNYLRHDGSIMSSTFNKSYHAIDHLYAWNFVKSFIYRHFLQERHRRLLTKLFISSYHFAIRHSPIENVDKVVKYAVEMYYTCGTLHRRLVKKNKNGMVVFVRRSRKFSTSSVFQKFVSLRYEYLEYRYYKVMRIFGIIVYKVAR